MDMRSISQKLQDDIRKVMEQSSVTEALKGGQVNLDKNKNGKIDKQDFKILKGHNTNDGATSVKEETIDENIMAKAKEIGKKALEKLGHGSDEDMRKDLQKKMGVPQTGKKPEVKEEAEQIDELSKKTLTNYVKKAHKSGTENAWAGGFATGDSFAKNTNTILKHAGKEVRRDMGITKAANRLAREALEITDEQALAMLENIDQLDAETKNLLIQRCFK